MCRSIKTCRESHPLLKKGISLFIALLLLASVTTAAAYNYEEPFFCESTEQIAEYILNAAGNREPHFKIEIPADFPETQLSAYELLKYVLRRDSGFIRWNHSSSAVKKSKSGDTVIYSYHLKYRTTKKMDDEARKSAIEIVDKWNVNRLTAREKIYKLRTYITATWRYDNTLVNNTANLTMSEGRGTCLGMTLASMLMLEAMDIPFQAVHGILKSSGELHIRLLVQIGDLWYTFDPVELARDKPSTSSYLKQSHGALFIPNSEYLTDTFRLSFPMTPGDLNEAAAG